jgi:glucosamine 6-phosphate synthetase-like amidotransferase/phosphosugar isomerase protein
MCGLFGVIRNEACDPSRASAMCVALGHLAEERGIDAAGLAMATTTPSKRLAGRPNVSRRNVKSGGWRIVKDALPFGDVWNPSLLPDLDAAPAVLGHTRWATQGDVTRLANASPLQVGQLIGTHNGDVETLGLRIAYELPTPTGQTDTEVLYQALDQAAGVIHPTLDVLQATIGRAALVWTDRRWPQLMFLARTAVSPLAIAVDDKGNLYWASNPGWFRDAADACGVRIARDRIWLMPEGTLLLVDFASGSPRRAGNYTFPATARARDDRLASLVAYRGFTNADRRADQKVCGHLTKPERAPAHRARVPLWA